MTTRLATSGVKRFGSAAHVVRRNFVTVVEAIALPVTGPRNRVQLSSPSDSSGRSEPDVPNNGNTVKLRLLVPPCSVVVAQQIKSK